MSGYIPSNSEINSANGAFAGQSSDASILDWLKILLPAAGGVASGIAQGNMSAEQIAENRRQFDIQQKYLRDQAAVLNRDTQGKTALTATQMDPMKQWKGRGSAALAAALMGNASPGGRNLFNPGIQRDMAPYLSADSRAASEAAFQKTAQNASPAYVAPDLAGVGYGTAGAGLVTPGSNTSFGMGGAGTSGGYVPGSVAPTQNPEVGAIGPNGTAGEKGYTDAMWNADPNNFTNRGDQDMGGMAPDPNSWEHRIDWKKILKGAATLGAGAINPYLGAATGTVLKGF